MMRTHGNEYLPVRKNQVVENLGLLETTFDVVAQGRMPEPGDQ